MAAVGAGDIKLTQIVNASNAQLKESVVPLDKMTHLSIPSAADYSRGPKGITIQGVGNLLTHLAGCCKPLPGDAISGYVTVGRGVTIHSKSCGHLMQLQQEDPERIVEVGWGSTIDETYPVDVYIRAYDRQGLLMDVSSVLAQEQVNIVAVNTNSDLKRNTADMHIRLEVRTLATLSKLLGKINQLPNIIEVKRELHS